MSVDPNLVRNCDFLKGLPENIQKKISDQATLAEMSAKTTLFNRFVRPAVSHHG